MGNGFAAHRPLAGVLAGVRWSYGLCDCTPRCRGHRVQTNRRATRCQFKGVTVKNESANHNRPHVLLITVDQWRGDCLGVAGHPAVYTPTLDSLAGRGVRFTRAYTSAPTCVPARAVLLTGLAPEHTGRIGYADGVPWRYPVTIASEFGRQGYQTEAIGKLHVYPERNRVGFDHVRLHDGYLHHARGTHRRHEEIDDYLPWLREQLGSETDYFDNGVNCNSVVTRPWDKPEHTHPTNWVVSEAIRFLDRRDTTQPFFLYLGFHRPHPPYDPPQWALDMYLNAELPEPPVGDWASMFDTWRNDTSAEAAVAVYPPHIRKRAQAGYYGHMTHIDLQLNRLLETMQERGLLADTLICFVSDHGELMGDHNLYRKSLPYEGSANVPFIIVPPATRESARGCTSEALVELRDVMPTLLDCAGLHVPEGLDGQSLQNQLLTPPAEASDRLIFGEHPAVGQGVFWITDGRWKYVWFSADDHQQLFDLATDPTELFDAAGAYPETVRTFRTLLVHHLARREDGHSDGEQLIPGMPALACLPGVITDWENRS